MTKHLDWQNAIGPEIELELASEQTGHGQLDFELDTVPVSLPAVGAQTTESALENATSLVLEVVTAREDAADGLCSLIAAQPQDFQNGAALPHSWPDYYYYYYSSNSLSNTTIFVTTKL